MVRESDDVLVSVCNTLCKCSSGSCSSSCYSFDIINKILTAYVTQNT